MIALLAHGLIGLLSGLHSASWGAYKDTPHEEYKTGKFVRSMLVGFILGIVLFEFLALNGIDDPNLGLFFLLVMSFERLFTESLKLFVRVENQDKYNILQTFNWLGKEERNRVSRLGMGVVFVGLAFVWFYMPLAVVLPLPAILLALIWGTFGGFGIAACGAWKDAPKEGFEFTKFVRSPFVAAAWAPIFSLVTDDYSLLVFACIGAERMTVEFYKTFIRKKHAKFKATTPKYPQWVQKRTRFILPYAVTWIFFFAVLV